MEAFTNRAAEPDRGVSRIKFLILQEEGGLHVYGAGGEAVWLGSVRLREEQKASDARSFALSVSSTVPASRVTDRPRSVDTCARA